MTARTTHRLGAVLGALVLAVGLWGFVAGEAAASAARPRCGYHVHVVAGYTVRLHKNRTSGMFGVYLVAPLRYLAPYGSVCINVITRRHLPLVQAGSGRLGSWMDIVHNRRSIFSGYGGLPAFENPGVVITLHRGTLAAIERCPRCFTFQVWPLGYRGRRPDLSARL